MKKMLVFVLSFIIVCSMVFSGFPCNMRAYAAEPSAPELNVPSAILIEASSGKILYEKNADEKRHPASVTKIMTLLLVMESIESKRISLSDSVTVSANASSMGGSQIFLKEGECMSVDDLVKAVTVSSANDAALALAEHVAGSEEAFVALMNDRAATLGMTNTHFENTNGLDDTASEHLTSARDIAKMSSELIKHEKILEYTTIWQDSVRNGKFILTNTNKLIRFYKGANGLKTGFTSKSGYCISASAKRDGMQLIAVIMGAESSDIRNVNAKKLLDYGFSNYGYVSFPASECGEIRVISGKTEKAPVGYNSYCDVLTKEEAAGLSREIVIDRSINAPAEKGSVCGRVIYKTGEKILAERDVYIIERVEKINLFEIFCNFLKKYFLF